MAQPSKPTSNYTIKTVGVAHAALLSSLQDAAYSPQGERFWSKTSFGETLLSHGVSANVVEVAGDPVGFCVMRQVTGEAEILTIGVIPASQRRGLGKVLLRNCINEATINGASTLFLEVRADNIDAIHTYRSCGFTESGSRKNYYRLENGQLIDALIYALDVKK